MIQCHLKWFSDADKQFDFDSPNRVSSEPTNLFKVLKILWFFLDLIVHICSWHLTFHDVTSSYHLRNLSGT